MASEKKYPSKGRILSACNCDCGCPCNVEMPSSYGNCEVSTSEMWNQGTTTIVVGRDDPGQFGLYP